MKIIGKSKNKVELLSVLQRIFKNYFLRKEGDVSITKSRSYLHFILHFSSLVPGEELH